MDHPVHTALHPAGSEYDLQRCKHTVFAAGWKPLSSLERDGAN